MSTINKPPMTEILQRYNLKLDRGGFIKCPFHNEKTASLKIYENAFKCFGCGCGGDSITFIMLMEKCTFKEALQRLNIKPVHNIYMQHERQKEQGKKEQINQCVLILCELFYSHRECVLTYEKLLKTVFDWEFVEKIAYHKMQCEMAVMGIEFARG